MQMAKCATILLDGRHRCEAHTEQGITEIAAIEWKEQPLDYQKNKTALLLESAQCNIIHGDRRLSRLGWTQEKISGKVGINQQRISQITNNANFGNIGNLLSRGHTMEYIAAHFQMDLALERLTGNQVQKMQDKRILGTIGRTLLVADG